MKKATLRNWTIQRSYSGNVVARGEIYNDEGDRFVDGEAIRTSTIQSIDLEAMEITTRNTIYQLD